MTQTQTQQLPLLLPRNMEGIGCPSVSQQQQPPQNGLNGTLPSGNFVSDGSASVTADPRTLDLKLIASAMRPTNFQGNASNSQHTQLEIFSRLPNDAASLLSMIECFTFQYYPRGPNDLAVTPGAALYYARLCAAGSPLKERMDSVVAFRCCGCRHTTQSPDLYRPGSTQIICIDFLNPRTVKKAIDDLRIHILACQYIPENLKSNLSRSAVAKHHSRLDEYLAVWNQALISNAVATGFPRCPFPPNSASVNGRKAVNTTNKFSNSKSTNMDSAPRNTSLHQTDKQNLQYLSAQQSPTNGILDAEVEIVGELESSISRGLALNNFGLQEFKGRVVEEDLTELAIEGNRLLSPLLELVFQSFSLVLRWQYTKTAMPGEKRGHGGMARSPASFSSHVFFQCRRCNDQEQSFCASAAEAQEAASFLVGPAFRHLCKECPKVPMALKDKLVTLKEMRDAKQDEEDRRVIQRSFSTWKAHFHAYSSTWGGSCKKKKAYHTKFWQPLSWRFVKENGGAVITDHDLSYKGGFLPFQTSASKELPHAVGEDDVLIGWVGEHVGNRRFLNIIADFRQLFLDPSTALTQQRIIALTAVRFVTERGGRFLQVSHEYPAAPLKELDIPLASSFTQRVMKCGYHLLLRPPADTTKSGVGSCVLEVDCAPQRDVFSKEIIRNKRFKAPFPEDDE